MPSASPYRASPGRIAGTRLFFLPQFRIYVAPIVFVLAGFFFSVVPTPLHEEHVGCSSVIHPRTGALLAAFCDVGPGRGCVRESGPMCERAIPTLDALLEGEPLRPKIVYGGRDFTKTITAEQARADLAACLPGPIPTSGSYLIPDGAQTDGHHTCATVQRADLRVPLVLGLFLILTCLAFIPSRVVTIEVDPGTLAVRVRDLALYRRARAIELSLDDLGDVIIHDGRLAFVKKQSGEIVPMPVSDRRPVELQRRTAARLRAFILAAHDRFARPDRDGFAGRTSARV